MTGTATVTLRPVPCDGPHRVARERGPRDGIEQHREHRHRLDRDHGYGCDDDARRGDDDGGDAEQCGHDERHFREGDRGQPLPVTASNINAAARYLKLYNKASAPTVGTDVPVLTIPIPATGVVNIAFGTQGFRFSAGIAFALTTGNADSDTTAAASEIKVMLAYI